MQIHARRIRLIMHSAGSAVELNRSVCHEVLKAHLSGSLNDASTPGSGSSATLERSYPALGHLPPRCFRQRQTSHETFPNQSVIEGEPYSPNRVACQLASALVEIPSFR
jgi:hypothetical protein